MARIGNGKNPLKSKTIWTALAGILSSLIVFGLKQVGIDLPVEMETTIATFLLSCIFMFLRGKTSEPLTWNLDTSEFVDP